jgi:hypothetical protein
VLLALLLCSVGTGLVRPHAARAANPDPERPAVRIPAEIPVRRASEAGESAPGSLRGVVIGLTILIALAVVTARVKKSGLGNARNRGASAWLGRLARGAQADGVRVVQSVRLSPRSSLHVVRWDGRELLVACGDAGTSVLGSRVPPSDSDAPAESSAPPPTVKGGGA